MLYGIVLPTTRTRATRSAFEFCGLPESSLDVQVMIKSASFLILSLRGFVVTCIYFWGYENREQLRPAAFTRQFKKMLRNKSVKFGEDQIERFEDWSIVNPDPAGDYTVETVRVDDDAGLDPSSSSPTDPRISQGRAYGSPDRPLKSVLASGADPSDEEEQPLIPR